jgi:hypothetical protein
LESKYAGPGTGVSNQTLDDEVKVVGCFVTYHTLTRSVSTSGVSKSTLCRKKVSMYRVTCGT